MGAPTFVGLPYSTWGIICLLVAGFYTLVWPRPKPDAPERAPSRQFILRWGHALVWILFSIAAFLISTGTDGVMQMAQALALLALLGYVVFILTFLSERRLQKSG